jgi:hypothetical protein
MLFIDKKTFERGLHAADSRMYHEDKIWSRYSNDKVDIGETLAQVIRTLNKDLPLNKKISALSIGSSNEPQFRILETFCRQGLYLLDIEKDALDVVRERVGRQKTTHVKTILADYDRCFFNCRKCSSFFSKCLNGEKINLVCLHHSLYYCKKEEWARLFKNLYRQVLAEKGAIHAVLMASTAKEKDTTTWLYNYFVGKFFGLKNEQDLFRFKNSLKTDPVYRKAQILSKKSRVHFFVDDFEQFMAVVWMILLYPNVHQYTLKQREEITKYIYDNFWRRKRPLWQMQDHMVIYRGIKSRGLI